MLAMGLAAIFILIILSLTFSIKNKPAQLELYIGENRRLFEGRTTDNMTVLDALNASSLAGEISLKYTLDPIRDEAKILSLDGYNYETNGKNLEIYLNSNKISPRKIHSIYIKPGDVILVKTE